MREKIYSLLVNRNNEIKQRYHKFHDGSTGIKVLISWIYLAWLNLINILSFGILPKKNTSMHTEQKQLLLDRTESEASIAERQELKMLIPMAMTVDVVSFDIFDTLIFRPFSDPKDLFYLIGEKLGILDFKQIRERVEKECRENQYNLCGSYEVSLRDIWERLADELGIDANLGMQTEMNLELELCYANPYMLDIYKKIQENNIKIIITTDMYLSKDFLIKLLVKNGYEGFDNIFVSNECGCNKGTGKIYEEIKKRYPGKKLVHVGDNKLADISMAQKSGLSTIWYPNINIAGKNYRAADMSSIVGGAYRGIVNNQLYSCHNKYTMEYEYGFIYGGLFVLGYCNFIHDYVRLHQVDKLLFLSRDGDVLKQAYDYLYPDENTEYVYWSRVVSTKMEFTFNKEDYYRRFIHHKVNQGYKISEVLKSMELVDVISNISGINMTEELTNQNAIILKNVIEKNKERIIELYSTQLEATKRYYQSIIGDSRKVAAVDIGWAGSGAMALKHLVKQEWKMDCDLVGIIAGTNTIHNLEPDASESFLQSGQLVAYLYSQSHNRDLLKKHDLNKDYNVFWELLLSSPTPQFKGFYLGNCVEEKRVENGKIGDPKYIPELNITLEFGKYDANLKGIREVQQGIMDFVMEYHTHFKDFPYMENISGRDAYAPMLVAASHNEKYLKVIEKKFNLEINVN